MLHDLTELVSIESPTDDKAGVDRAQDYLSDRLRWAGAEVTRLRQSNVGDCLRAVWRGDAGGRPPILMIGHVDTVWPLGELARRPMREEDGYFYGPGAFDMKAGLLIGVHAMRALRDLALPLRRDVILIVNSDEEIGSLISRPVIEAEAQKSHAALILEPAFSDNSLTVSRKGIGRFLVRVAGRAAHSGRNPQEGINAIEELARQILALQALSDFEHGVTVNVGVARGGTRPNVVPAEASAEVDLRIASMAQAERLTAQILGLRPIAAGAQVSVSGGVTRPPWDINPLCEALFQRARAIGLALGMPLERRASGGGSDGNYTAALGVPTLDGLGPEGAGAHAIDERVRIASIGPRAGLLAGLLLDLANAGEK